MTTKLQALTEPIFRHAAGCKKDPTECKVCRFHTETFERLAPQDLSKVLEDRAARVGRFPLAAVALGNYIDRTWDDTKRAKADLAAALPLLKNYGKKVGAF